MSTAAKREDGYRSVNLPGLGDVLIPSHLSEEEVLAEVQESEGEATQREKTV